MYGIDAMCLHRCDLCEVMRGRKGANLTGALGCSDPEGGITQRFAVAMTIVNTNGDFNKKHRSESKEPV